MLESSASYADLVDVASTQSELLRVKAGDPQGSYLIHKLEGTQSDVGGYGNRMPIGADPLTGSQLDIIRGWITAGAKEN